MNYLPNVFGFLSSLPRIMTSAITIQTASLIKKLNDAEKRAQDLNKYVESIKLEISLLKQSVSGLPSLEKSPTLCPLRVQERSISLSSSSDSLDGLLEIKRKRASFDEEDGSVIVYTDGACQNNGKANAKAGIGVWFGDNHPLNVSKPVVGRATNNTAEIQACIEALKVLESQGKDKVKILTDSEFTISCMTKWIKNWRRNNWKTANGKDVKNMEDLQVLDRIMKRFEKIEWTHVPGHSGHKGNDEADRLARAGAVRYQK